jgi:hypothetical protein
MFSRIRVLCQWVETWFTNSIYFSIFVMIFGLLCLWIQSFFIR